MKTVILGSGITGLTLACKDKDSLVVGLRGHTAQTFNVKGYLCDRGIHCVNTLHPDMPMMMPTSRVAKIDLGESFTEYPYQVGRIDNLVTSSDNYEDYLVKRFGQDAMDFHIPYAIKFWGTMPDLMSSDWCSTPQMPKGTGANTTFYYPAGGIEDIWEKLYDKVKDRVIFAKINYIDTKRKEVCFDGQVVGYDRLYSTLPLQEFAKIINCPTVVDSAFRGLKTTEMYIYSMGIDKESLDERIRNVHWVYNHKDDVPFVRFSIPSNWNHKSSPRGKALVQYECPKEDKKLVETLTQAGYEEVYTDYLKYAYCVPLLSDKLNLEIINDWCERHDIFHRGRFGRHTQNGFTNMWMHQCLSETI